ncbi:hypothetical protein HanIR_Chr07g0335421 [Helianthus annuus]|nr:hypothetical protein HanIR_Chr07g0335421 [Helianthus annuus]
MESGQRLPWPTKGTRGRAGEINLICCVSSCLFGVCSRDREGVCVGDLFGLVVVADEDDGWLVGVVGGGGGGGGGVGGGGGGRGGGVGWREKKRRALKRFEDMSECLLGEEVRQK